MNGDYNKETFRLDDFSCEKPEFLGMSNHLLFIGSI